MHTKRQKYFALFFLLLATFLSPLDFYIVNLALSPIQKDLGASSAQLQMIISFYTSAYAVFQITSGRLGDITGRKRMFNIGLIGFIASSAMCGLADNADLIIIGRILQGTSGAIMAPQILAFLHVIFSEKEQTMVMGLYSFTFGLAAVLGQFLGGLLISLDILGLGWRILFLINLPVGLIAFIGVNRLVPRQEIKASGNIDILGIVLFSSFLALVIYPLTQLNEQGFGLNTIICFIASFLCLGLFILHQKNTVRKGKTPLIDMKVFEYRNLRIGSIVAFLFYCSGIFYLAFGIYLQDGLGWEAMDAGIAIIPFGLGFLISSLAASKFSKYIGDKILRVGLLLYALGFILIVAAIEFVVPTNLLFYTGLFIAGVGMGSTMSSIVRISLKGISSEYAGLASGVINSALQIGSAISVAAIGSVFFSLSETYSYTLGFQVSLGIVVLLLIVSFFRAISITKN